MHDDGAYPLCTLHPAVTLAYGGCACVLVGLCSDVFLIAVAFGGYLILEGLLFGWSALAKSLPWKAALLLFIVALNSLFLGSVHDPLFRLGPLMPSAQGALHGLTMGMMLLSLFELMHCLGALMTVEGASSVLRGRFPLFALGLSMVLRLVPELKRRGVEVRDALGACTASGEKGADMKLYGRMTSTLMEWAMEDAITSAGSMRARGWGSGIAPTFFRRSRFTAKDALALSLVLIVGAVTAVIILATTGMTGAAMALSVSSLGVVPFAICALFGAFVLLPSAAVIGWCWAWRS